MTDKTENEKNGNVISLAEARRRVSDADISQNELAVLSRLEARERGLHRARKCVRSNVSMFLSDSLPDGHVRQAIKYATEKYLGVEIDVNLDVA